MPRTVAVAVLAVVAALTALALAPLRATGQALEATGNTAPAGDALPGVDLSQLSPEQAELVQRWATGAFCYCGCPHTVATCLRQHGACKHAGRMAAMAARLAAQGAPLDEVRKALDEYYAGFDPARRAKLDVKDYGPPLGKADARVTFVEFSDFTCPFCQALRPVLEKFVADHEGRVRLFYKPFPIPSHPRSKEAAIAAEWARDHGKFWAMHDLLFDAPHALDDDDLAAHAAELGLDGDDLRAALGGDRYKSRIVASLKEARDAGLTSTPTIFVDGQRLELHARPDAMADVLGAVLDDEEEWSSHGGHWTKD